MVMLDGPTEREICVMPDWDICKADNSALVVMETD